ncbi:hypothetical protein [Stutzerimonas stutzeri]|uniref:hypothetical protein n=1 Tax=Stutzerimonas stutzeri TaxID=316 RepID=UPI000F76A08B|nr:hypothetical protein [Stutzerimonas stutzeri]MCP3432989.1 hypothetical protein [Stutzerimonas stutzeri]RRV61039.1 hypothetical protein EGJ08_05295 [Stutzerimonas stutzeri]RTM25048.1 hypothetical protein EKN22_04940 [Stutzerimonas stutzeri]
MGNLIINRKPDQRVFLSPETEADAAELYRPLTEEGIWLELYHSRTPGQIVVCVTAPPAVNVVREELLQSSALD